MHNLVWLFLCWPLSGFCQFAGQRDFRFLDLPPGATIAGLGGVAISKNAEPDIVFQNPSFLASDLEGTVSINYSSYKADIGYGTLIGCFKIGGITSAAGIQYLDYGVITEYDEVGNLLGEFTAADYLLMLSAAHNSGPFSLGGSLKFVQSRIGQFNSNGFLFDIGGNYQHPKHDLALGIAISNFGFQLNGFNSIQNKNSLPFNVVVGGSFKPEHMPFRFNLALQHLNRSVSGEIMAGRRVNGTWEEPALVEKLLRPVVLGTEFILNKHLYLLAGYNVMIRQDLRFNGSGGGAGLSAGIKLKVRSFAFTYAHAFHHVSGGLNHFSIQGNMRDYFIKKN